MNFLSYWKMVWLTSHMEPPAVAEAIRQKFVTMLGTDTCDFHLLLPYELEDEDGVTRTYLRIARGSVTEITFEMVKW